MDQICSKVLSSYMFVHDKLHNKQSTNSHLGNYISSDILDRNITSNICDLCQRSNSIINNFRVCDSDILDSIHNTFCMYMYGCELWNLSSGYVAKFKTAWRKIKRRIWKLHPLTHNMIVHNLSSDINVSLETRNIKFIHNALGNNNVYKHILSIKLRCRGSCFADNFRFLSYKYNLCDSDWNKKLSFLMGKVY